MCTCDRRENQIDLSYKDAAALAYSAQEGDTDSLILLLEGIKEVNRDVHVDTLIHSAVIEVFHLCSFHSELKQDCIRRLIRKFRRKGNDETDDD